MTEPKIMYDVVLIIDGVSLKGLYDHSLLCRLNYDREILMYVYNNTRLFSFSHNFLEFKYLISFKSIIFTFMIKFHIHVDINIIINQYSIRSEH